MNILPLVLLLILTLSVLTLKQVEDFKNLEIVRKECQDFIRELDKQHFNHRQRILYDNGVQDYYKTRKLNLHAFFDQKVTSDQRKLEQLKQILKELMKVLYAEADFFKKIEKKRPDFLTELVDQITDPDLDISHITHSHIENLSQIKLSDPELQEVFYHMLKGTIGRKERKEIEKYRAISNQHREKSYLSLLNFLSFKKVNSTDRPEPIPIYQAPKELLLAIYEKEAVNEILIKRREFKHTKKDSSSEKTQKKESFADFIFKQAKVIPIDNEMLDPTVSTTDPEIYD